MKSKKTLFVLIALWILLISMLLIFSNENRPISIFISLVMFVLIPYFLVILNNKIRNKIEESKKYQLLNRLSIIIFVIFFIFLVYILIKSS